MNNLCTQNHKTLSKGMKDLNKQGTTTSEYTFFSGTQEIL